MIHVKYRDRLGNKLFQYCLGRILADKKKYVLKADPIDGFNRTHDKVYGNVINHPKIVCRKHRIDIDKLLKYDGEIILDGWFQRWEYYEDYERQIRNWLYLDPFDNVMDITDNDLLIHVRLGDYFHKYKRTLKYQFYEEVFARCKFDKLFICSDELSNREYLQWFDKYNPWYVDLNPIDTLKFMKLFNKIALSMSTFSWWGAFLSDATEIYYPICKKDRGGCWGRNTDIDLRIDSPRYVYLDNQLLLKD